MNRMWCLSLVALMTAITLNHGKVFAGDLSFQNLSDEDFKNVVRDLSANFTHTSVSGAAPLGDIFGFEVGLVGGVTKTPELNKFAQGVDSSAKVERIPHAELLGVLTVPLAITVEAGILPRVGNDDMKFSAYSLAAKWTPSELFFDLPVDLAIKLQATKMNAKIKDDPNNIPTTFDYKDTIMGATFMVSKNFAILEPYAGIGFFKADGDMDVTGSPTVFVNGSQSASAKPTTTMFLLGTEVKLLVVKLGVEYSHLFDTNRFTGKLSFYF